MMPAALAQGDPTSNAMSESRHLSGTTNGRWYEAEPLTVGDQDFPPRGMLMCSARSATRR